MYVQYDDAMHFSEQMMFHNKYLLQHVAFNLII